jgi:hypothetical protein
MPINKMQIACFNYDCMIAPYFGGGNDQSSNDQLTSKVVAKDYI